VFGASAAGGGGTFGTFGAAAAAAAAHGGGGTVFGAATGGGGGGTIFGKKAGGGFGDAQQQPGGFGATAGGGFSQVAAPGADGSHAAAAAVSVPTHTDSTAEGDLIAVWTAAEFQRGKIPEVAPPQQVC